MPITNKSKNILLAEEAIFARTFWERIKGLLGKEELKHQALVIKPCQAIHTFFMRFPIDVLFVDRENRIIKTIPYLKPFHTSRVYLKSSFVVELPAGTIKATLTQEGDIIYLI